MARRIDKIALDASKARLDKDGRLVAPARFTRTGVFVYHHADGSTTRELRTPDQVFSKKHLDSLKMAPVTLGHPPEWVNGANFKKYAVGATGSDPHQDGKYAAGEIMVQDGKATRAVLAGDAIELSAGYEVEVIKRDGVWGGERYDSVHMNPVVNHVAIVTRGRAGADVRVILDSDGAVQEKRTGTGEPIGAPAPKTDEGKMAKIAIDGVEYEINDAVAPVVSAKLRDLEAARADVKQAKDAADVAHTDAAKLRTERDTLQAKVDAVPDDKNKPDVEKIKADALTSARERLKLEDAAGKHLPKDYKFDGVSDTDVKLAAINLLRPKLDLKGKSADYVDAMFDTVTADAGKTGRPTTTVADSADDDPLYLAYKDSMSRQYGQASKEDEK